MSAQYNTDGLFTFPTETHPITMNALESVECTIAFDVKDWREDRRSAWIYLIVFGWDEETDEVAGKFGWDLHLSFMFPPLVALLPRTLAKTLLLVPTVGA